MNMPVDLQKWFWRADDGRVYSSERAIIVDSNDPAYLEFAAVQPPAPWPRDVAGNQTEAVLAAALAPLGLGFSLLHYAEQRRWEKETAGITVAGVPIATDDRSKQMVLGARVAAMADENFTTNWVAADGAIYQLDAATVTAISDAVLAHVRACFAVYATVRQEIATNTITTKAQVDAAFAAIV